MTAERLALARLRAAAAYPDYIPCPHCGEPEVEVWSYENTARCHNCAQTFEAQPAPQLQSAGGDLNFKLQNSNFKRPCTFGV